MSLRPVLLITKDHTITVEYKDVHDKGEEEGEEGTIVNSISIAFFPQKDKKKSPILLSPLEIFANSKLEA